MSILQHFYFLLPSCLLSNLDVHAFIILELVYFYLCQAISIYVMYTYSIFFYSPEYSCRSCCIRLLLREFNLVFGLNFNISQADIHFNISQADIHFNISQADGVVFILLIRLKRICRQKKVQKKTGEKYMFKR